MRFLVLGATGMVGHVACLYLAERGHDVVGTYRAEAPVLAELRRAGVGLVRLDVFDGGALRRVIESASCNAIVNCVALLNLACEKRFDLAIYINSYLPHRLEQLTGQTPCKVIHVSTDGVFAGNPGPHHAGDILDDYSAYGRTKALGELDNCKDITLRTCVVGPDPDSAGVGLLNWFMGQEMEVGGYSCALWTGLSSLELARLFERAAASDECGIVQAVPRKSISKFELLRLFNEFLKNGEVDVRDVGGPGIDRRLEPSDSPLCVGIGDYREQMSDLAAWMRAHSEIYPHYKLEVGGV